MAAVVTTITANPMKKDYRYDIESIREAYRYRALRMAVFTPLFGKDWIEAGCSKARAKDCAVDHLHKLRTLWRARLGELREAGWPPVQDGKGLQFLRNCPPFGCHTGKAAYPCRRRQVCPFCYARLYVLAAFRHLEDFAFGGTDPAAEGGGWVKAPAGLKLVEFQQRATTRRWKGAPKTRDGWTHEFIERKAVPFLLELMNYRRKREMNMLRGQCGTLLHTIEPRAGYLVARRSGLVLTRSAPPKGFVPEGATDARYKYRLHREVTKQTLARAAARVFAYPTRLMTGSAPDVVAVLGGLANARLLSTYGPYPPADAGE